MSIKGGRLGGSFAMMLSFFVVYVGPEDLPLLSPAHYHADVADQLWRRTHAPEDLGLARAEEVIE